jgi:hypothetical protein
MSFSIYYTAHRKTPLTPKERALVNESESRYTIEGQIVERERTGEGYNWTSFCVYDPADPTEPDVVFEGATQLPDNSEDAVWTGLQHWCQLLTEIRRAVHGASWRVTVDDHEILWDEKRGEYDPSV